MSNDYTIPNNNRELKHFFYEHALQYDYTIPNNNRELKPAYAGAVTARDYTIPNNNRELKQTQPLSLTNTIIPYQTTIGN